MKLSTAAKDESWVQKALKRCRVRVLLGHSYRLTKALFCVTAYVEPVYFIQDIMFWKFAWVLGKGESWQRITKCVFSGSQHPSHKGFTCHYSSLFYLFISFVKQLETNKRKAPTSNSYLRGLNVSLPQSPQRFANKLSGEKCIFHLGLPHTMIIFPASSCQK